MTQSSHQRGWSGVGWPTGGVVLLLSLLPACGGGDAGASAGSEVDAGGVASQADAGAGDGATPALYPGPCRIETDEDADGDVDLIQTDMYDSDDRRVRRLLDLNANGNPDWITAYTYDAHGRLHVIAEDFDATGVPDAVMTHIYDQAGRLVRLERDRNADGTADATTTNHVDGSGELTMTEHDDDGDGVTDRRVTFSYQDGKQVRIDHDDGADGLIESRHEREFDGQGFLIELRVDDEADQVIDFVTTYTNDSAGRPIRSEYQRGSGELYAVETRTYDSAGRLTRVQRDDDADGGVDSEYAIAYDSGGNRLSTEWDHDADGQVDARSEVSYDCFR